MNAWEQLDQDIVTCRACPRLVNWRELVAQTRRRVYRNWEYWGKPVPAFGDPLARVLVVGLAPGAHGSNRTGRMFTGDRSGEFLYPALHRAGFASQPGSIERDDGLVLEDMLISAVCRCAPPGNKPALQEILTCLPYLEREIGLLGERLRVVVALGRVAFEYCLRLLPPQGLENKPKFAHGAVVSLGTNRPWLVSSYHPSQQNTQTGKLTVEMFDRVWSEVRRLLSA